MANRDALCSALVATLRSADPALVAALGLELEAYKEAYLRGTISPLLRDIVRAMSEGTADPVQEFFDALPEQS
jgi:hypothetical protein